MAINKKVRIAGFILLCISNIFLAQTVTRQDLVHWKKTDNKAVSADGNWAYYTKTSATEKPRGIFENTRTGESFEWPDAEKFFLNRNYFLIRTGTGDLHVKDLTSGTTKIFKNTIDFEFDPNSQTLLIRFISGISLHNLKDKTEREFTNIEKTVSMEGTSCTLLFTDSDILLLNRETGTAENLKKQNKILRATFGDSTHHVIKILWQEADRFWIQNLDYFGNDVAPSKKLAFVNGKATFSFLTENMLLETLPNQPAGNNSTDDVQVWSNSDKAVQPKLLHLTAKAETLKLYDLSLSDPTPETYCNFLKDYYLVFGDKYVLELDDLANYSYEINDVAPRPAIRLRKRETGTVEMEVQEVHSIYPSAKLGYILYFKDRDWYRYEVSSRKTVNLTSSLDEEFHTISRLNTHVLYPVDNPWFSPDYRFVYLSSKNDIWQYDNSKEIMIKLTKYEDRNYAFKIIAQSTGGAVSRLKWHNNAVLQYKGLVLSMTNKKTGLEQGLALWKNNRLQILSQPKRQLISQVKQNEKAVSYVIEDANTPQKLIVYSSKTDTKKLLDTGGAENDTSDLPRTELREWTDSRGEKTYTTIVLPPGYSPINKYPAIVRIYENEAKRYKEFEIPSFRNPAGFNRTLMAMEGYIVILPRITYAKNKVGQSALKVVEETVKKVLTWYSVDSENIGIIGHSFGGYETNYILTQSSIFKTAVSGSGIADIIADYFTVHKMYLNSNMSRYTNEQFGFSDDFFSLKKEYLENNPILMADQIKTPLLLWSGNKDEHVEWRQSVEMFMALSGLKKEVRLLLFPDDAHVLVKPKNQTDATERILQWFNYYLKNGEKPAWF